MMPEGKHECITFTVREISRGVLFAWNHNSLLSWWFHFFHVPPFTSDDGPVELLVGGFELLEHSTGMIVNDG